MSRLDIALLGSIRATLNGETITRFGADAARALLAYLALHARTPCRRETLAGLLWPDQPEAEARHNLRQALTRLRKAIEDREANPPFLLITHKAIQFNPESDHWLDVAAFDGFIATCQGHRHRRLDACRSCIRRLQEAVDLYRGELMGGFSFPSAPFEGWLVAERERVHRQALDALDHLATYHERRGEHEQVQGYARRQVELEPWREGAHRQWMRALALSGQRGAALAQYETCRRALEENLGVAPAVETMALYARIRDEKLDTLSQVPPHNLPVSLTPFVGREAEMAEIEERLGDPDCRLLTLVGPGGSGKTRLAQEAAAMQVDAFSHGVYFCSLAALQSAEAIVPTVARTLGFSFYRGADPGQQLLDYLRHKSMLLVLDNYEHLLRAEGRNRGGGSLVVDILRAAQDVTILVTSRERLNVPGEHLFPVGGMDYPIAQGGSDPSPVGEEERYSSVQLFFRSAQRVRPGFGPAADDWAHIARICRLVGGMPLGILLAASWVQVLTPAEIATQIGQDLDFLETDMRDMPRRQHSIRAVFDHSWNLLTEQEREIFRGLSVFRGGFTHQAAQAVADASLRELMALTSKSLLHRMPVGRYEIHELLRQYAAEKLNESPDADEAAHDRHCAYYVAALRQWEKDSKGPRQQAALSGIEMDIENARAAWNWTIAQGQIEQLDHAINGLCRFYEWRGRFREGEAACRAAAKGLETIVSHDQDTLGNVGDEPHQSKGNGTQELRAWARILTWQSAFSEQLGRTEFASRLLRQCETLLASFPLANQDTRLEKAFVLRHMGRIASDSDRKQAERLCRQSLALYRTLGDPWEIANALNILGLRAENLGEYGEAERLVKESIALSRALGDRRGIAHSSHLLGVVAQRQGRLEDAERLFRESIAIHQEIGDQAGAQVGLYDLALTMFFAGRYVQAQPLLEECLVASRDRGIQALVAQSNILLGHTKTALGRYEPARDHGQIALALSREIGFQRGIGNALVVLSRAALARGAYSKANDLLQESVTIFCAIGHQHDLGYALALLGLAAHKLGRSDQARQYLCESLQTVVRTGAFLPSIIVLPAIALLLIDRGEAEQAIEFYTLALDHPFIANSRWFEDVVEKHIVAAAATLLPDAVAAAQERGRARDLGATVKGLLAELESDSLRPAR